MKAPGGFLCPFGAFLLCPLKIRLFMIINQTSKTKKEEATMATKKSMWILFGTLVISAWVLGSITQAGAQTYTMKCRETGYAPKAHPIEVGDVPGHIIGVGEYAGVLSCDDGSIATTSIKSSIDYIKGSGKFHSYWVATYEDGSTSWTRLSGSATPGAEGKTASWESLTGEFIKGTGRFEGIKGSVTFTGKRLAPSPGTGSQYYIDWAFTYTLPSK